MGSTQGSTPPTGDARRAAEELERAGDKAAADGQTIDALRAYDRVIGLGVATADTWQKTGDLLLRIREFAQAIGAYENSIELDSSRAATHHNLARALFTLGDVDRAIERLRQAAALTDLIDPIQGLANLLPNAPSATHAEVLAARQEWARRLLLAAPQSDAMRTGGHLPADTSLSGDVAARPSRPVRVAYLSAHFAGRNYMKPVWGLINHHDRETFRIYLLSDKEIGGPIPGYRHDPRDTVIDVSGLDDVLLADVIAQHQIDILIDLSAYSQQSRMSLFTRPVAPVTIAWFNMFATSGFPGFDYIIGDAQVVLPDEEAFYSERVLRLPMSYLTFQVDYPVPDVAPLPCLRQGRFTFGSLVSLYKITPPVLDVWAQILRACPEARLLLANADLKSPHNRSHLLEQFVKRGVDAAQINFLPPTDHDTFLRYYDQIDLALDAFPYNGGTTTMEAIWQGVPVLTKEGDRWAARTSQTLLRECHLAPFVATDAAAYAAQAVDWASNSTTRWPELAALRRKMRDRLRSSSVCDSPRLAREMESLFRQVWAHTANG